MVTDKPTLWKLAIILVIATVLRCVAIETRGIQYDDAFSYFLSIRSLPEIIRGTAADTMPPLYYFLLHFWSSIHTDIWFLRVLSVLLNLATIVLFFIFVNRLSDKSSGLWAAFLVSISPIQIYHAQDLRMYALIEFLQIAYLLFFILIEQNSGGTRNLSYWLGLVISGALSMYTHNLAIFVILVPVLYLLFRKRWALLFKMLCAGMVIAICTLPWLWLIPGQIGKVQNAFWTPRPGLVEIFQTILLFTATLPLPRTWLLIGAVVSLQLMVIIVLEIIRRPSIRKQMTFLFWLTLAPPTMLFILSYLMRPVFVPRGFLVSSLGYYSIAGLIIAQSSRKKTAATLLMGGFLVAAALSLPYQYQFNEFPRSPFRELTVHLQKLPLSDVRIIHDNKLSFFPCKYYAPNLAQVFLPDEPGSPNDTFAAASQSAMDIFPETSLESAMGNSKTIYFVYFSKVVEEYKASGIKHPVLENLEEVVNLEGQIRFGDLFVNQYSRP